MLRQPLAIYILDSSTQRCFKHDIAASKCANANDIRNEFAANYHYDVECLHFYKLLQDKLVPLSNDSKITELAAGEFVCLYHLPKKANKEKHLSKFNTWKQQPQAKIRLLEYPEKVTREVRCCACMVKATVVCQTCNQLRRPFNYCNGCFATSHVNPNFQDHQAAVVGSDGLHAGGGYLTANAFLPNLDHHPGFEANAQTEVVGWECNQCTLVNRPHKNRCVACDNNRSEDYIIPDDYQLTQEEEEERQERLLQQMMMVEADKNDLNPNTEAFECSICFNDIAIGEGVTLKSCLHMFCRDCLVGQIINCEQAVVACPYSDGDVLCSQPILEREIKKLCPEHNERLLERGLQVAEAQIPNSFHCKTVDCRNWCIYEDQANFFDCTECEKRNCLTCRVIHEGMDCKEYQDDLKLRMQNDDDAKATMMQVEMMIADGEAMKCPQCEVVIMKKAGCDWLMCSICQTEICWVTKQARWGPGGNGDTSGGCRCGVNRKPCHPDCTTCH